MDPPQSLGRTSLPPIGRRTYVIDRGFQLKYIVVLAVVGAGVSALFGAMMYLAHVDAARALPIPPLLQGMWQRSEGTMIALTAGMTVLMAAALSLFGVLITHRVAGPVYVMSYYMSVLAKGRYPVMRPLRNTDELRTFFERFQEAVESMRQREVEEAETLEHALKAFTPLAAGTEAAASLQSLQGLRDRKREATDRVKVTPPAS